MTFPARYSAAPVAATAPTPILSISRAASVSDTTRIVAGPGDRHKPATTGFSCHTVVSNITLLSSIAANAAANSSRARQLDHIGTTRTAARSIAGEGWRSERHTARAIAHAAPTVAVTTAVAVRPAAGNSISAHTSDPMPSTTLTAPSRSGIPVPVAFVSERTQGPAISAANTSGMLTKKIHR